MKRIFTRFFVFATLLMVSSLSAVAQKLTDFYEYATYGKDSYKISLTSKFKTQLDKTEGGELTSDGFTWKTGDPLPNPAPDNGMYDGKTVVYMSQLFKGCTAPSLDLSEFDTRWVVDMSQMFEFCDAQTIKLSKKFVTSNVNNMKSMFGYCSDLTELDLTNFNTSLVTNMSYMFYECRSLKSLFLSSFNTANVTDMSRMFYDCESFTSLDVSMFKTDSVHNMAAMFGECENLKTINVSKFNTSNVTSMSYMFYSCDKLTGLDVSNFNTSKVANMSYMFDGCSGLSKLDVTNFNTSSVTNTSRMFANCSGLSAIDVTNLNTAKVKDMSGMFAGCSGFTKLDISNFNTENVKDMNRMFSGCSGLINLNLSNFKTDNVTDMSYMFSGCSNLGNLDVSYFNSENVTDMSYMFSNCTELSDILFEGYNDVGYGSMNTEKVENMDGMFYNCGNFTSLDISCFSLAKGPSRKEMFVNFGKRPALVYVNSQSIKNSLDSYGLTGADSYRMRFVVKGTHPIDPRSEERTTDKRLLGTDVTLLRTFGSLLSDDDSWSSLCLPFSLSKEKIEETFGEGTKVAEYTGRVSDKKLEFLVVDSLEAGKPYLIKAAKYIKDPIIKNVDVRIYNANTIKGDSLGSIDGAENCVVNMHAAHRAQDPISTSKYNTYIGDSSYVIYAEYGSYSDKFYQLGKPDYSNAVMGTYAYFSFNSDYEGLDVSSFSATIADVEIDPAVSSFTLEEQEGVSVRLLRSFTGGDWATLCLPFNLTREQLEEAFGEGVKVASPTEYSSFDNTLAFSLCDSMAVGKPYLIKPKKSVKNPFFASVDITYDGSKISSDSLSRSVTACQTVSRGSMGLLFGTYSRISSILKAVSDEVLVSQFDNEGKLEQIKISRSIIPSLSGTEAVWVSNSNTMVVPTVIIDGVKASVSLQSADPVSEGGVDTIFNLKGQQVTNPQHGFYIKNGKKVYIGK